MTGAAPAVSARADPGVPGTCNLGAVLRAALVVEYGAGARGRPQPAPFPAFARVVDASVDVLGEETERVGNAELDELAVDHREQRFAAVGFGDRHVPPQAQRVVAVYPHVVRVIGAAPRIDPLELRPGHAIERPALGAMLAGRRCRTIQGAAAFAPVEARDVAAREHRPDDAVRGEIEPARAVGAVGR